jgi:hypothetical protein
LGARYTVIDKSVGLVAKVSAALAGSAAIAPAVVNPGAAASAKTSAHSDAAPSLIECRPRMITF